jgi:hypothetical protein
MTIEQGSPGAVEYRVALIQPNTRLLLALNSVGIARLPRVHASPLPRRTEQLRSAIYAAWGLSVFVLDVIEENDPSCCVAEVRGTCQTSQFSTVSLAQILAAELSDRERTEIESLCAGEAKHEVCRLGWIDEAAAWVENVTQRGVRSTDEIEQFSAGDGFALVRFHADDGASYWLKAVGEPHSHELPITALLSEIGSEYLPAFVAMKAEWNAWLMSEEGTEFAEAPAWQMDRFGILESAVQSMAELQIRTIGRTNDLRRAGAFHQSIEILAARSEALFEYLRFAMTLQTSTRVSRIEGPRLQEIRHTFEEVCGRMSELKLPETVIHGDMSADNILVRGRSCCFIDWSEAYIGVPLVTLQHLLLLNQPKQDQSKEFLDRVLIDRYRKVMEQACDFSAIEEAIVYMPLLAAASTLCGRGDWMNTSSKRTAWSHSYARSLARHMDRAARSRTLLDALAKRSRLRSRPYGPSRTRRQS